MKTVSQSYDVIVCGGGLAGFCAAVAAARNGAATCLVHNRPVLGGNSSSEIGVTPHGAAAFHAYARETGILSEALIEERAQNHAEIYENGWTNSVWDMVLYDIAKRTPNLTLHLNTDIRGIDKQDARNIAAILAVTQNAEVELCLEGRIFIDCTGDGIVADTRADWGTSFAWRWYRHRREADLRRESYAPSRPIISAGRARRAARDAPTAAKTSKSLAFTSMAATRRS